MGACRRSATRKCPSRATWGSASSWIRRSIVAFGEDDFNTYVRLKPENGRVRYRYHGSWFKEPGAARSATEYEEMLEAVARLRPEVRVGPIRLLDY